MTSQAEYKDNFPNIQFDLRDCILQVTLHTRGKSLKWRALENSIHEQAGEAFYRIGRDNRHPHVVQW